MHEFLNIVAKRLGTGHSCALACIVESRGSVPGGAGTFMVADENGRIYGTVGGGALELFAEETSKTAMKEKRSHLKEFALNHGQAASLGMVCGGNATLLVMYIEASAKAAEFFKDAYVAISGKASAVMWAVNEKCDWEIAFFSKDNGLLLFSQSEINVLSEFTHDELEKLAGAQQVQADNGGCKIYSVQLGHASRALIFGGGHVAQSLVPVLAMVGFNCTVFDDRPDFAAKELFPAAQEVVLGSFEEIEKNLEIKEGDYIVVVTRGHAADFEVERQVLLHPAFPFPYIGVIGSKTKTAAVTERLVAAGVAKEKIETVHAPIGLAIGAKTPAEIAVAIAAQMVQVRAETAVK